MLPLLLSPPAAVAAYYFGGLTAPPPAVQAARPAVVVRDLAVDPAALDLGEVWESPDHAATVPVRNVGKLPVRINRWVSSCDCTAVEPNDLVVPPGGTAAFTVKLDLTHRLPYHLGLAKRDVTATAYPVFAGDAAPTPGWPVKATVKSRVTLDTHFLAFADLCPRGSPVTRKVRATAHLPLIRLEAVAVPPGLGSARVEDEPGGKYLVHITPDAGLPVGPFKFQVKLTAVTPDGERHGCATIEASGEVQPAVRVLPRVVLLGEQPVGTKATADVTVKLPAAGWAVKHVEADSPGTTATKSGADPDGEVRYAVAQEVAAAGDFVAKVWFVMAGPAGETERVPVEVRYHGQPK